jgi:hypothetical protein
VQRRDLRVGVEQRAGFDVVDVDPLVHQLEDGAVARLGGAQRLLRRAVLRGQPQVGQRRGGQRGDRLQHFDVPVAVEVRRVAVHGQHADHLVAAGDGGTDHRLGAPPRPHEVRARRLGIGRGVGDQRAALLDRPLAGHPARGDRLGRRVVARVVAAEVGERVLRRVVERKGEGVERDDARAGVAQHGLQLVERVRPDHARRRRGHGPHAVGHDPGLQLGLLQRGDVVAGADEADRPAELVGLRLAHAAQDAHLAAGPDDALLKDEAAALPAGLLDRGADCGTIVGVDALEVALEADVELARLEPEDAVQLVGPGDGIRVELPLPASEVGELLLAPA